MWMWEDGLDGRTSGKDLQDDDDDSDNDGDSHVPYGRPGPMEKSETSRQVLSFPQLPLPWGWERSPAARPAAWPPPPGRPW